MDLELIRARTTEAESKHEKEKEELIRLHAIEQKSKEELVRRLMAETARNGELQKVGAGRAVGLVM